MGETAQGRCQRVPQLPLCAAAAPGGAGGGVRHAVAAFAAPRFKDAAGMRILRSEDRATCIMTVPVGGCTAIRAKYS